MPLPAVLRSDRRILVFGLVLPETAAAVHRIIDARKSLKRWRNPNPQLRLLQEIRRDNHYFCSLTTILAIIPRQRHLVRRPLMCLSM